MTDGPVLDTGELYRVLAASAQDTIITIDEGSIVLSVNPAGERLFGYSAAEMIGSPMGRFIPERYRAPHRAGITRYLSTGQRNISWNGIQLPILTKDGREIPTEISFGEFTSGGRKVFSGILRDISERLSIEATLAANAEILQTQAVELEQQMEEAQVIGEELEQANQELHESNTALERALDDASAAAARLREVLDNLTESVSVFDSEWRWTYVNPSARTTLLALGRDPDTIRGKVLWDELPELKGTRFETETRRAVATNRQVSYEEYLPSLDRWYANRIVPSASSITTFSADVTEQRKAAEVLRTREAEYRALANSIPTLAWMAQPNGWIFWYNARWYEYTGTTPSQMEGWGWQSVHDPVMLPHVLERWAASIATGEPFEMTFPLRSATGEFRAFLTRVVPVRDADGNIVRWFGTNTDIEVESRLRRDAEEANRVKAQFLATMSHELRTPLNAVGGYAELLQLGIHGPVTDAQQEALGRIQRSQRHLLALINDLLNFAKLEAGQVEFHIGDVSVEATADSLETLVAPQLALKKLRFSRELCNGAFRVRADADKLQQILVNLLSNAIKFTPEGGEVALECRASGDSLRIGVRDTGIGIAADRLEQIFAPFVQIGRNLSTVNEGVGLGLAISRDLARGMGGDLTVTSVEGEGSTFTLVLPGTG